MSSEEITNGVDMEVPNIYWSIGDWVEYVHHWAHAKGFYLTQDCTPEIKIPCQHIGNTGLMGQLMLVVTELAEAAEALRQPDHGNFAEEIADTVIRLFDLAGACGIDLAKEIQAKMEINQQRPYRHGKTC